MSGNIHEYICSFILTRRMPTKTRQVEKGNLRLTAGIPFTELALAVNNPVYLSSGC